jgi:hypothetical protein
MSRLMKLNVGNIRDKCMEFLDNQSKCQTKFCENWLP